MRTDNGGGINYYPVYQLGNNAASGSGNVDMTGLGPTFSNGTLAREAAAALGIVTETHQAFTRSGSNLTLNGPLVPAFDQTTIPYYNLYLNDTWHLKSSITLTYGLGWSLEMPPVEAAGKQVVLVDANNKPINAEDYLNARKAAALEGNVYNPEIGFALIPNVAGHPKYPFDPFYGGVSPRVSIAWNPDFGAWTRGKEHGVPRRIRTDLWARERCEPGADTAAKPRSDPAGELHDRDGEQSRGAGKRR